MIVLVLYLPQAGWQSMFAALDPLHCTVARMTLLCVRGGRPTHPEKRPSLVQERRLSMVDMLRLRPCLARFAWRTVT